MHAVKNTFVQIYHFKEIAEMQNAAGETRHLCCLAPLSMNDKMLADRAKVFVTFIEIGKV